MLEQPSYKDEIKAEADKLTKKKTADDAQLAFDKWTSSDSYQSDVNTAKEDLKQRHLIDTARLALDEYKKTKEYDEDLALQHTKLRDDDNKRIVALYEKELEKTKPEREKQAKRDVDSMVDKLQKEEEDRIVEERTPGFLTAAELYATRRLAKIGLKHCETHIEDGRLDTILKVDRLYSKFKNEIESRLLNAQEETDGMCALPRSNSKKRKAMGHTDCNKKLQLNADVGKKFVARSTLKTGIDRSKPRPPFTAKIAREEYGLKGWTQSSFFTRQVDFPHHIFQERDTSLAETKLKATKNTVLKLVKENMTISGFEWGIDIRDYVLDFTENKEVDKIGQKIIDEFNAKSGSQSEECDISDSECTDSEDDSSPRCTQTDSTASSSKPRRDTSNKCERRRCAANVDNRHVPRDKNSFYVREIATGTVYLYASVTHAARCKSLDLPGCAISDWVSRKAKNQAGYDWGICGSWIPIEDAAAVSIPAIPLESRIEQDLEEKDEDAESLPMPIIAMPCSSGSSQPLLTPSVPFEASKTVARSPCPAPVLPRLPSTVR